MAREENLRPFTSEQSRDEAVTNGRKGGKASGTSRRRKKEMRKLCEELLEMSMHGDKLDKIKVLDDAAKHANVTVKEALPLSLMTQFVAFC